MKDNETETQEGVENIQENCEQTQEVSAEITVSEKEFENLKQEVKEFKHKYLELLADAENARKRMHKDKDEVIQYAIRNIILDFLHPIDHMENALRFTEEASDEVKHWATGFNMILNQFREILSNNGVKPIDAVGQPFDPHLHEAIEMVQTDQYPDGIVVEESTKGYLIGEKTLRPSRVKVSQSETKEDEEKN